MNPCNVFLLFEQSGTFKGVFHRLGVAAFDYDICNTYGQTDYVLDIFTHIHNAYDGAKSLFDAITPDDLIIAFFPCTYFSQGNSLIYRGTHNSLSSDPYYKAAQMNNRFKETAYYLQTLNELVAVCEMRGLRLIIENPITGSILNYAFRSYTFCDVDTQRLGDCYKKPTAYWFVNCKPATIPDLPSCDMYSSRSIDGTNGFNRSVISTLYAENFIKLYIIGDTNVSNTTPSLF